MTDPGANAAALEDEVPVALFVYRRHGKLPRTLECLERNGVTKLYVYSDGPADAAGEQHVATVREIIASIDWIEPITVEHEHNLGLSESIRLGLDELFDVHEKVIVIEDDISVAPEFYDFARLALDHYSGVERVAGVTGLRFPFSRAGFDGYPFDVFMSPRFSSWGWATWRERWREFVFDLDSLRGQIETRGDFHPERAGGDMADLIKRAVVTETLTGAWDVVCATNMLMRGQFFVTPTWNMVENRGLVEGTHTSGVAPAWDLRWETALQPALEQLRFAPVGEDARVLTEYLRFHRLPGLRARLADILAARRAPGPRAGRDLRPR
jgi:hypothetical protein